MLRGECLPKRRTAYSLDSSVYYMDKHWPASKLSGAFWRRGEKRKESLQLLLWNLNSASNSPVAPRRLSEAERGNERKCKQTLKWHAPRVMKSFLMSSSHFSVQIFKFQRRSCKLSFLFPSRRQSAPPGELAHMLEKHLTQRHTSSAFLKVRIRFSPTTFLTSSSE